MSVHENDWKALGETWRATREPVNLAPLKRIVSAHRRRLLFVTAGEVLLVAAFAVLSWYVASDGIEAWEAIWLVTLWSFTLIAVAFAIANRRGTWNALGESVDEYIRITRLRAERQIRSLWFACGLFVAELIAVVIQLVWFDRLTLFAIAMLFASAIAIGAWCVVVKRRVERELRALDQ